MKKNRWRQLVSNQQNTSSESATLPTAPACYLFLYAKIKIYTIDRPIVLTDGTEKCPRSRIGSELFNCLIKILIQFLIVQTSCLWEILSLR